MSPWLKRPRSTSFIFDPEKAEIVRRKIFEASIQRPRRHTIGQATRRKKGASIWSLSLIGSVRSIHNMAPQSRLRMRSSTSRAEVRMEKSVSIRRSDFQLLILAVIEGKTLFALK